MVPFDAKHLDEITKWYKAQESPLTFGDILPPIGFIEEGVAAGFLVTTDAGFGLLEGYVSNPEAPSQKRHEAFLAITERLLTVASAMGFKMVLAITRDPSIIGRATTLHDFNDLGLYCLLNKEV